MLKIGNESTSGKNNTKMPLLPTANVDSCSPLTQKYFYLVTGSK
jgi:hypothetical protein